MEKQPVITALLGPRISAIILENNPTQSDPAVKRRVTYGLRNIAEELVRQRTGPSVSITENNEIETTQMAFNLRLDISQKGKL